MSYGFNRFLDGRRFVKLLSEWNLRNAMDGSVLCIAVNTEGVMDVLGTASKVRSIVREVLFIRTAQGSMNLMSRPIHCP